MLSTRERTATGTYRACLPCVIVGSISEKRRRVRLPSRSRRNRLRPFNAGVGPRLTGVRKIVEVAGDDARVDVAQRRLLPGAAFHRLRAARVEAATGRRVERARHLAGQDDLLAPLVGVAR